MSTCVIVLGAHRSGTSLVAGLLRRLGVYMGTWFREADEHNATGYWEDMAWRDLHKSILAQAGGTWFNPPQPEDQAAAVRAHDATIESMVAGRRNIGVWGYKDPRTCLLLQSYYFLLPVEQRYVIVRRPMSAVCDSLERRAKARGYSRSLDHWGRLYRVYEDAILEFLIEVQQGMNGSVTMLVDYRDLMDREKAPGLLLALGNFCGLDPSKQTIEHAVELIRFKEDG